jgi:hypothetical protein
MIQNQQSMILSPKNEIKLVAKLNPSVTQAIEKRR